jgi:hypothetical protein
MNRKLGAAPWSGRDAGDDAELALTLEDELVESPAVNEIKRTRLRRAATAE